MAHKVPMEQAAPLLNTHELQEAADSVKNYDFVVSCETSQELPHSFATPMQEITASRNLALAIHEMIATVKKRVIPPPQ